VTGVYGVTTPDANTREAVSQIGNERRVPLDQKEALRLDSMLQKSTGDGSGSCTYFKNA
jgi:hypothetical protein